MKKILTKERKENVLKFVRIMYNDNNIKFADGKIEIYDIKVKTYQERGEDIIDILYYNSCYEISGKIKSNDGFIDNATAFDNENIENTIKKWKGYYL